MLVTLTNLVVTAACVSEAAWAWLLHAACTPPLHLAFLSYHHAVGGIKLPFHGKLAPF